MPQILIYLSKREEKNQQLSHNLPLDDDEDGWGGGDDGGAWPDEPDARVRFRPYLDSANAASTPPFAQTPPRRRRPPTKKQNSVGAAREEEFRYNHRTNYIL